MFKSVIKTSIFLGMFALSTVANAGLIIDTTPSASGSFSSFSESDTATYGQRITMDQTLSLDSFSFFINQTSTGAVDFIAYVYEWNGSHIVGNELFNSGLKATTNITPGFAEEVEVLTGGIELLQGLQYALFFSTSATGIEQGDHSSWTMAGDSYDGGGLILDSNANDFNSLFTDWDFTTADTDFAFVAEFSTTQVPEPSTLAIFTLGLMGLASRRFKKKS